MAHLLPALRGRCRAQQFNASQRRKLERAQEHIGYMQTVMRHLVGEGKSETVSELELAFDVLGSEQEGSAAGEGLGPTDAQQQPSSEEERVIRLPARQRR